MRGLNVVLGLSIGAFCVSRACADTAADAVFADGFDGTRWVEGYYVGYERDLYPIGEVDFSAVTHLMVGRARPLADGTVTTDFDIDNVNGPIWAQAAVDAAHAAGRAAVLMVGGGAKSLLCSIASTS